MKTRPWLSGFLLGSLLAACGNGNMQNGDAGADVPAYDGPPRTDKLNVNCGGGTRGDQPAVACNADLMAMEMGARFWVGGRSTCSPNPNAASCQPLCELSAMNADNCTFAAPQGGCPFRQSEGYVIVVESPNGRRASTAVGMADACSSTATERHAWARVAFEDLRNAAACARVTPEGGFGAATYGTGCATAAGNCEDTAMSSATPSCCALGLMAGSRQYRANVSTRACTGDAQCGPRGRCSNGLCLALCGGPCATQLNCDTGFQCQIEMGATDGVCLPLPPQ